MEPTQTFSEQSAKQILARAIELDHIRGANYTVAELRSMAAEVGVSDAALAQAMEELGTSRLNPVAGGRGRLVLTALIAGAITIGVTTGLIDLVAPLISGVFGMGVVLMLSGGAAVAADYRRVARGLLRFEFQNAALWMVYAATWTLTTASGGGVGAFTTSVFVRTTIVGWAISSVFGALLAAAHAWRTRAAADTDAPATSTIKRRIADKLKSWIDAWVQRTSVEGANTRTARS